MSQLFRGDLYARPGDGGPDILIAKAVTVQARNRHQAAQEIVGAAWRADLRLSGHTAVVAAVTDDLDPPWPRPKPALRLIKP